MTNIQELRFKFYHELDTIYHHFFDDIAAAELADGDAGRLTQAVLLSRQEGLKHLVSTEEMDAYLEAYPGEE
jgi:hercynine metabolism small protein